jgi:ABC-type amino acid transport system permease subunit
MSPVGNYVGPAEDTSIADHRGAELMLRAKDLASSSFMPMQLYVLAVTHFLMSFPLAVPFAALAAHYQGGVLKADQIFNAFVQPEETTMNSRGYPPG